MNQKDRQRGKRKGAHQVRGPVDQPGHPEAEHQHTGPHGGRRGSREPGVEERGRGCREHGQAARFPAPGDAGDPEYQPATQGRHPQRHKRQVQAADGKQVARPRPGKGRPHLAAHPRAVADDKRGEQGTPGRILNRAVELPGQPTPQPLQQGGAALTLNQQRLPICGRQPDNKRTAAPLARAGARISVPCEDPQLAPHQNLLPGMQGRGAPRAKQHDSTTELLGPPPVQPPAQRELLVLASLPSPRAGGDPAHHAHPFASAHMVDGLAGPLDLKPGPASQTESRHDHGQHRTCQPERRAIGEAERNQGQSQGRSQGQGRERCAAPQQEPKDQRDGPTRKKVTHTSYFRYRKPFCCVSRC